MKVVHKKTNTIIAKNLKIANTFFSRLRGLMFVDKMTDFDALLLVPGNSIHNCFVKFPIDVIFLDENYKIIKIIKSFKPWRFSWIYLKARMCLELPEHSIIPEIKEGDYLEVQGV